MEAIVLFLLNAAASGAIGHYISKALKNVDEEVGTMIEKGASAKEIEKVIERKHIEGPVTKIFNKAVTNSIIISTDLSIAATPDDKVQMLKSIVTIGFRIANDQNFDLILPGSPWGPNSLSFFEVGMSLKSIEILDRTVDWNQHYAKLVILPMSEDKLQECWKSYLDDVRRLRADSKSSRLRMTAYLKGLNADFEKFEVAAFGGGTIRFRHIPPASSPTFSQSMAYGDWNAGIRKMLAGVSEVRDLNYLPPEEWNKLKEIVTELSRVIH